MNIIEEVKLERLRSSLDWLFLLSEPESVEGDSSNFDNLESDSWEITDGMARSTETSNEHFIVLIDKGHTTVLWYVCCDSFVVFLELDSHTLSDGRVGLLGFYCDLFNNDSCSM